MIPEFNEAGLLPPGVHVAEWDEVAARFGSNAHRLALLGALSRALEALRIAGCTAVYLDGSFVSAKEMPGDYDLCWSLVGVDPDLLDPVLLTFDDQRRAMKAKYLGDLFPAQFCEDRSGQPFLEFFQVDKDSGATKGIVRIDLRKQS